MTVSNLRPLPSLLAGLCLALAALTQADAPPAADPVVVVSPASGVSRLSRQQVADLFLGRIRQFPNGARAVPVDQAEGNGLREAFNDAVLERTAPQIRAHWAKIIFTGRGRPPQEVVDGEAVKRLIARDPHVIGYIDRSLVDEQVVVVAVD